MVDLGLVHSSAADNMVALILNRLRQDGDVEERINPHFLVRKWPPAFREWSTRAVRDAFFASPQFPRLLDADSIKDTIARGVTAEIIAYVGKAGAGGYDPFYFGGSLAAGDVEISDDMFIITAEEARKHIEPPKLTAVEISPRNVVIEPGKKQAFAARGLDQHGREISLPDLTWRATGGSIDRDGVFHAGQDEGTFVIIAAAGGVSGQARVSIAKRGVIPPPPEPPRPSQGMAKLSWSGEVPHQKWMNFYTKVLSKFAGGSGLKITVNIQVAPEGGISMQKVEEARVALRELGLGDEIETS